MTLKRCAYLTMDDPGDFVTDYDLSFEPMLALGWQVDTVAWRDTSIEWDDYDAVYICTPWDYPQHAEHFIAVLEAIERSSAILVNELSLVRWTLAKTYLRDLEECGAAIVPSLWFDDIDTPQISDWFRALGTETLVIKPDIGANAKDTYVLEKPVPDEMLKHLLETFENRPFFVQPFVANIQTEGEYALFFFSGEYSHAILKTPKSGDFRVQEEYGADIVSVDPPQQLIDTAHAVLALIDPQPVYVRADFVRGDNDQFWLMELELIEPSMYLRMDKDAPARFANAFDRHVQRVRQE